MAEWVDLGERMGEVSPTKESKIFYPSFSVKKNDIGKMELGDTLEMRIQAKVVSADIRMGEETQYRLEVKKIKKQDD